MPTFATMKKKFFLIALCMTCCMAEGQTYFNTIGVRKETDRTPILLKEDKEPPSAREDANPFLSLPAEELEEMARNYVAKRDSLRRQDSSSVGQLPVSPRKAVRMYRGRNRALSYHNLVEVMEECGIRQQLYVIAQACLETGWFTSKVFRQYNNLFGLYDSRKRDYYRFSSWEDSVIAYRKYIQYRYKGGNYLTFLRRIGYAEDPQYTAKVAKIVKLLQTK